MTHDEMELLAAEYVLGTLDAESRRRAVTGLASDPSVQELVAAWERRLGPLAEATPEVGPPPDLWDAIDAAIDASSTGLPGTATIRASEGAWETLVPGIEKKLLHIDRDEGSQSYLLRVAPGARLPAHTHKAAEECLVIEGDVSIGGLHLVAGDYHVVPAGIPHPEASSVGGAVVFIRGELEELAA